MSLTLRPLAADDLPRMTSWLNAGTVLEWYGLTPKSLEEVAAEYGPMLRGDEPSFGYIALLDSDPVGYGQWYRLADHPDYAREVSAPPHSFGIDLFIADPWQGRGLGVALIEALIGEAVRTDPTLTVALGGPDHRNVRSIATFQRAGFTFSHMADVTGEEAPEAILRRPL